MRYRDVRIICDCQRHAARERRFWRRSLRLTQRIALIVGLPLTLGAIGIPIDPIEAMNTGSSFHIFTTPRVEREFLAPATAPRQFTIETAKEAFFTTRVPYGSIIYREAIRNGVPPELVAGVIQAESDFRVRLVSDKNAKGLMQIVPSTGRDFGASDLFNPEENIATGTKYLRYLLDRFPDQRIALAAYNAGEGTVERCNCVPEFAETRDYVRRVNDHTRWFRRRMRAAYLTSMRIEPAR